MSTYVFLNIPARGHINPTLPIVRELSARGANVIYFLPEPFRELVEAVGGKFQALQNHTRSGSTGSGTAKPLGDDQIAILPFAMALRSTLVVPQLVESIKTTKPDCLVYNTMNLWARLVAQILGVRAVGFRPFHAPRVHRSVVGPFATEKLASLAAAADQELDRLAHLFGLSSLNLHKLVSVVEDLILVFMPKEFQFDGEAFDSRFSFVGPSLLQDNEIEEWPFAKPVIGECLRVYISLGTLRNNEPEFYRACLGAFDQREWQVVMSVGHEINIGSLGPIPENFVVKPSVKQVELLPNVDVFVSHGGLNSTMESLYFGVPLVVIPSIREQRLTARRVQELRLGIALDREELTPENLRECTRIAAHHSEMRTRVKVMQEVTRAAGGFRRATEALVKFTSGS